MPGPCPCSTHILFDGHPFFSVSVLSLFCLCSVSVPTGGRGGGHSDGQVKELVGVAVGTRGVPLRTAPPFIFCLFESRC